MKRALVVLGLLAGSITFTATEASAFVCARGVYRAGCVGPMGRAVVAPIYSGRQAVVVRGGAYGPRRAIYGRRW